MELREAGVDLLLLQFSPQLEEMERFAEEVIPRVREREAAAGGAARPGVEAAGAALE